MSRPSMNFVQDFKGKGHYGNVEGQDKEKVSKVKVDTEMFKGHQSPQLHRSNQYLYKVSTPYTLWFPKYSLILMFKVPMVRAKFKSRSHHDVAYRYSQPVSLTGINHLHLIISEM